jgi:hypothetical protein
MSTSSSLFLFKNNFVILSDSEESYGSDEHAKNDNDRTR